MKTRQSKPWKTRPLVTPTPNEQIGWPASRVSDTPKSRSKPSSYEGNFSAAHRTSTMDRSQCDAPDGWERWESQTVGTVFSVEFFWIVDFILNGPSKQLPPGFHGNSVGIFLILKKRLPCFLRLKKRWHFFSNVRSPNHSPGKSSVVTGTPFNPKNTSWHLEKCLHNQSPWHPQHSEGFVTYPFTIFSTTHILLAKSCQHSRRFDLGIG